MSPLHGIALKIASVMLMITMAAIVKAVSDTVPPGETVFFRAAFAIPVIAVWLVATRAVGSGLKVHWPMGHVLRGVVGTLSMGLSFAGLGLLPLPEVTAIGYAAPLLTVVFAAMFLGEEVRLFRYSVVALGLSGVLIVLSPRLTALSGGGLGRAEGIGALVVLASTVFAALAQVTVRRLVMTERTPAIVFYFSLSAALLSLLTLPFGWVVPPPRVAALLVLAGLLGGVGQILLTSSYRFADASVIAPFEYTSMLLALAIGYGVFGEVPTPAMLGGASLVVFAGILIIWRERRLGLERARTRKAMTPQV